MIQNTNSVIEDTAAETDSGGFTAHDAFTEIGPAAPLRMFTEAMEQEVSNDLNDQTHIIDENGRGFGVRNGSLRE